MPMSESRTWSGHAGFLPSKYWERAMCW
jgi:hypothetical protein